MVAARCKYYLLALALIVQVQLAVQTMKRSSTDSESTTSDPKRRKVSYSTYQKWKVELDRECNTLTWLDCDTSGSGTKKTVEKLKCTVCIKYASVIQGRRNYGSEWINGADSVRSSNIKDHHKSDQYAHAMMLFKKREKVLI